MLSNLCYLLVDIKVDILCCIFALLSFLENLFLAAKVLVLCVVFIFRSFSLFLGFNDS